MLFFQKNKSFTLIEMLVVVALISLIASLILVSMTGARAKARDSKRKQDIAQLEKALLMYWEKFGQFPGEACCDSSLGSDNCNCPSCSTPGFSCTMCTGTDWCSTSGIWSGIVGNGIMGYLPKDPINNTTYYYWYEPCCGQECRNANWDGDCDPGEICCLPVPGGPCCEYTIGAIRLETTGSMYSKWGRWEK